MKTNNDYILRKRMHGQYLSRKNDDITELSRELLGLHCWFHRNVVFSALIRGADITGWKTALTKTWLYRGTLHGVAFDDLRLLLALNSGESWMERCLGSERVEKISNEVLSLMEDGIYSRAEMRRLFAHSYDPQTIATVLSPWGGIFVHLAMMGKVAFRNMTSRDFDLISAEPIQTREDVIPELLRRYFKTYGPATLSDAAYFFGIWKEEKKKLKEMNFDEYEQFKHEGNTYYHYKDNEEPAEIPELTLLSGFDPFIVSYIERGAVLPKEYKKAVILSSGICLPTIAVNGRVVGLWNIKKGEPVTEFFESQPARITNAASDMADEIRWQTAGRI